MKEERDDRIPFSCTLEYDREACGDCENLSRKKEHCGRYEGAYNY